MITTTALISKDSVLTYPQLQNAVEIHLNRKVITTQSDNGLTFQLQSMEELTLVNQALHGYKFLVSKETKANGKDT